MVGSDIDLSIGLWLDEAFEYGSWGRCETFGNEPLAASADFKVSRVEMWGFEYSAVSSPTEGPCSPSGGFSGTEQPPSMRRVDSAPDTTAYGFAQIAGLLRGGRSSMGP